MLIRRAATVTGLIQGVGFRPFVHRLAQKHGIRGLVCNLYGGVRIEIEGTREATDAFAAELTSAAPPLAHIEHILWNNLPLAGFETFEIIESDTTCAPEDFVPPDFATCADCIQEIFNPADRRFGYAFTTCVNCGPRLSIIEALPYDRDRTTMSEFPLCSECLSEYKDPNCRRFHAESIACPNCGPCLSLKASDGRKVESSDPIAWAASAIRKGSIGAIKGIGGFHLVCNAQSEKAVLELRRRKMRDEKPFAIMARSLEALRNLCAVNEAEAALLHTPAHPIVLLRRRNGCLVAPSVAPGNPYLGAMLPYSPLHHLLLSAAENMPLVVTSGNASDTPIVYENTRAHAQLGPLSDFVLTHNRRISLRSDDSVSRIVAGRTMPLRRSRGFAPAPVSLPHPCALPTLALGGQMKDTFAMGRGQCAILSHHMGDLDEFESFDAFKKGIAHFEKLFDFKPEVLVHDLHPDYMSTRYALERHEKEGIPFMAVQHHHAHIASCMAEHGLVGPVIGVSFDGTGYGTDNTVWGGEFLVADYGAFERAAHFRQVPMPGGEKAIREPWRMALSHLIDAGEEPGEFLSCVSEETRRNACHLIATQLNSPLTSSCGRLFDAVSAITGRRASVTYEGQAAMQLEWLASECEPDGYYPVSFEESIIDTRPIISGVAQDVRAGVASPLIARRFHETLVEIVVSVCARIRAKNCFNDVVLSGGVFMNVILSGEVETRLLGDGFKVYQHSVVPPNDGGLSLGQLAIAAVLG